MPAIPRQRRYDQVMGDREPKVADKRFVQELQQRLEDRYMTTQCTKEKRLAESESKRMRKLVLDGVIESEDKRRAAGDAGKLSGDEWKEFWPLSPNKTLAEYQEEKKRKSEESRAHQHGHENSQPESATNRMEPTTSDEGAAASAEPASGGGGGSGGDDGATRSSPRQRVAPEAAGRYEGSQSPRIDTLMAEEDLDELYRKAAEIVYIMTPPAKAAGKAKAK